MENVSIGSFSLRKRRGMEKTQRDSQKTKEKPMGPPQNSGSSPGRTGSSVTWRTRRSSSRAREAWAGAPRGRAAGESTVQTARQRLRGFRTSRATAPGLACRETREASTGFVAEGAAVLDLAGRALWVPSKPAICPRAARQVCRPGTLVIAVGSLQLAVCKRGSWAMHGGRVRPSTAVP